MDSVPEFFVGGPVGAIEPDGSGGIWALSAQNELDVSPELTHISRERAHKFFLTQNVYPESLAVTPDGTAYVTETLANKIGVVTPQGRITEYATPTQPSYPVSAAAAPDGVWFAEGGGSEAVPGSSGSDVALARIDKSGTIVEYHVTVGSSGIGIGADGLRADSSGGAWFVGTRHGAYCGSAACPTYVGHIDAGGNVVTYPLPAQDAPLSTGDLVNRTGFWFLYNVPQSGRGVAGIGVVTPRGKLRLIPKIGGYAIVGSTASGILAMDGDPPAIFDVSATGANKYRRLKLPDLGYDPSISATLSGNRLWLFYDRCALRYRVYGYAYSYSLKTQKVRARRVSSRVLCGGNIGTTQLSLAGGRLWAGDPTGLIWSVPLSM